jgi:hypothetical protein
MSSRTSVEEALKTVVEHSDVTRGLLVLVSLVGLATLLVYSVCLVYWLVKGESKPKQTFDQSERKNNANIHLRLIGGNSYQIVCH